jgi:hypothetical protein
MNRTCPVCRRIARAVIRSRFYPIGSRDYEAARLFLAPAFRPEPPDPDRKRPARCVPDRHERRSQRCRRQRRPGAAWTWSMATQAHYQITAESARCDVTA